MLGRAYGIARSLVMYHGVPGRHRKMVRFYGAFLGPGDIGIDVGAHVGSRVRAWRALGARVIAVEPQPDFTRILRESPQFADRIIQVAKERSNMTWPPST